MIGPVISTQPGAPSDVPPPDGPQAESDGVGDFASVLALAWTAPSADPAAPPPAPPAVEPAMADAMRAGEVQIDVPFTPGSDDVRFPDGPSTPVPPHYGGPVMVDPIINVVLPDVIPNAPLAVRPGPITLSPTTPEPTPSSPKGPETASPAEPTIDPALAQATALPTNPVVQLPSPQRLQPRGAAAPVVDRSDRAARASRESRIAERVERPERAERAERPERPERPGQTSHQSPSNVDEHDGWQLEHVHVQTTNHTTPPRNPHATGQELASMLAGVRKPVAPINASSLKPLFDAKPTEQDTELGITTVEPAASGVPGGVAAETNTLARAVELSPQMARATFSQTVDAVLGAAERLGKHETRRLDIRLTPEDLGDIEVRLTRDGGGKLSALLMADREATRHTLTAGVDALRGALERAGVQVDRLDVSVNTGGGAATGDGYGAADERAHAGAQHQTFERLRRAEPGADADDDRLLSIRA